MTTVEPSAGPGGRRPVAPNAAQKALLRRLQAVVAQTRSMLDAGRIDWETGVLAAPSWFARLDTQLARSAALADLGRAGGIPQRWIEFVHARGEQGLGWRTPQRWPDPQAVARTRLIDALAIEARDLGEIAAVHTAYRHHAAHREPALLRTRIETTASLRHRRITTVAAMLDLIGPERDRISPAPDPIWARALAATVRDRDPAVLAHQWRTFAEHQPPSVTAYRLLSDHGDIDFAADDAIAPPPAALVEHIAAARRLPPGLAAHDLHPGAATDSAVDAALGEIGRLEFTAVSRDHDQPPGVTPTVRHHDSGPSP